MPWASSSGCSIPAAARRSGRRAPSATRSCTACTCGRCSSRNLNLHIRQAEVAGLVLEDRRVTGVRLRDGRVVSAAAVIVTTGTFLNGLAHVGEMTYTCGRNGEAPSQLLGEQLRRLGLAWTRLKTGTPPRLDGRTIDWARFEPQPGDAEPTPFSFLTERIDRPQVVCHIGYTTEETQRVLLAAISRSPLYSGQIEGIGPAVLPLDRRQDGEVPGQAASPDFSRTRGPGHQRGLRQRHVHEHADRRAGGDDRFRARPGARGDDPAGVRHRVRRHRPPGTGAYARGEVHPRAVPGRADQRNLRLRGGGVPGADRGNERRVPALRASRRSSSGAPRATPGS